MKSGAAVGVTRLIGSVLGLLVTVLIGRMLGPEALGVYGYAVILLALIAVPVSNGWATLLLRQVAHATHGGEWSQPKGLLLLGGGIAALIALFAYAVGWLLLMNTEGEVAFSISAVALVLLALVLFFDQLSALRLAVLRGLDHPVWGQIPEMVLRPSVLLLVFVSVGYIWLDGAVSVMHAFWALLAGSVTSVVLGVFVLWKKSPKDMKEARPEYFPRLWFASLMPLIGTSGLVVLNAYVDTLMLGALSSFEEVGIYRVATQVALVSGLAYTALNMLAAQRFAYFQASGESVSLQMTAVAMARLAMFGACLPPLVLITFGELIIAWVFGAAFLAALLPMLILCLLQLVNAFAGMAHTLLVMSGYESRIPRITFLALIANIVLSALLIPAFGAVGAAIASLSSLGGWNICLWLSAKKLLGVDTSVIGVRKVEN